MKMAVDMSSIMWTCLRVKGDAEQMITEWNGKQVKINTAMHGYENAVNSIKSAMEKNGLAPIDLILVFEGMNGKRRRLMISPTYKSKRAEKSPLEYEQFQLLKDMMWSLWRDLGATLVSQDNVEGDDVLGWLACNTEEDLLIHSNDGDLQVLGGVNKHGAKISVWKSGEPATNSYGPFPTHLITTYKALVGDSTDSIKGCPGFGPGKFLDFVGKYGLDGLEELQGVLASGSLRALDDLPRCKLLDMLLKNEQDVLTSFRLAQIHPEWVNTLQQPLEWFPGMVKATCQDERLTKYAATKALVTNANLIKSYEFLKQQLRSSPFVALDIESSSLEEADDWLAAAGRPDAVDPLGSKLCSFSLTFGRNTQHTLYFSIDHRDTDNISLEDARLVLEAVWESGLEVVIQNVMFEGTVLAITEDTGKAWRDHWRENGFDGLIPNWRDTAFEASYVDENSKRGLKERSQKHLGYTQLTYDQTTKKRGLPTNAAEAAIVQEYFTSIKTVKGEQVEVFNQPEPTPEDAQPLPSGGRIKAINPDGTITKQYKMNELTALEVLDYGADDTICTAALHVFYKLHMQLEHHYQNYLDVEISASYMHCDSYIQGKEFSLEEMNRQKKADDEVFGVAWGKLRDYLIEKGWAGTQPHTWTPDSSVKDFKLAYRIWTGKLETESLDDGPVEVDDEDGDDDAAPPYHEDKPAPAADEEDDPSDAILSSRLRKPEKFPALLEAEGHGLFARMVERCLSGPEGAAEFTAAVNARFKGEPAFKASSAQMCKLLYEVMGFECKVFNKPTAKMKAEGRRVGNPKGDALALAYCIMAAKEKNDERMLGLLEAIQIMQMVRTRRSLYYNKYPGFIHWKTGRIHSQHNQCSTNTRRASSAAPNDQQLPKHPKIEGYKAEFRKTILPHKSPRKVRTVVVSLDFSQQELRIIAEQSQDPNLLACYVGDNKKDMHILTALGIVQREKPELAWDYEAFLAALAEDHEHYKYAKKMRALGKKVNFTTEFGAMAPKLAATMLVSEATAQAYIDAKEEVFAVAKAWKKKVIEEAKTTGFTYTMLGSVRHLGPALRSDNYYDVSKAERQSVNFRVQGSGAEMTKLAEGRIWDARVIQRFDAAYYGPIHDELVFSVAEDQLVDFLKEVHPLMEADYANMQVPIVSSISFGPTFGQQYEIGELPTQEAVNDGYVQWKKEAEKELQAA